MRHGSTILTCVNRFKMQQSYSNLKQLWLKYLLEIKNPTERIKCSMLA